MCIRDSPSTIRCDLVLWVIPIPKRLEREHVEPSVIDGPCACLLYTSDAADERSSVDLGGRRIIKKKNNNTRRKRTYSTARSRLPNEHGN